MGSLLFYVTALVTLLLAPGLSAQVLKRLSKAESEQLNEICGKTYIYGHPRGPVQRIAHGNAVHQGELPWAVYLRVSRERVGDCSASIISKYHIITAAHCVMESQTYLWFHNLKRVYSSMNIEASFLLGGSTCADSNIIPSVHKFWNSNGYEKPRKLRISKIIVPMTSVRYEQDAKTCYFRTINIHGQGIDLLLENSHPDIAILELEDPISDVGDRMVPICVPSHSTSPPLEYTQYGFGLRDLASYNMWCHKQLRKLPLNSGQFMERVQSPYKSIEAICEKMLAVYNPGGKPCGGDSGGGLSGMSYGKHYLFGVLHGTDASVCGDAYSSVFHTPFSLYTNVMPYIDFLCYHIGVCPLGYDVYMDMYYKWHPEGFLLFTKEGQSISVDEGNFGFLKRRDSKNETLGTGFSPK